MTAHGGGTLIASAVLAVVPTRVSAMNVAAIRARMRLADMAGFPFLLWRPAVPAR